MTHFNEVALQRLARNWLNDLRQNVGGESEYGAEVVELNFSAPPEVQWKFIFIALSLAESDDELSHIAAGPIEHLLGWHGEDFIEVVEREVKSNSKFGRALTGVWQYMMSDEVWSRVQRLQAGVSQPLQKSR